MGEKSAKLRLFLFAAAGSGWVLAGIPAALASGFGLQEGAADWLANGFAGEPAKAYDPSTVWTNPAGMARLDEDEVEAAASYIAPAAKFTGSATDPLTGQPVSGGQGGNIIAPAAAGAAFGVADLGPDWRVGFSLTAPFGDRTAYPRGSLERYQSLVSSITDIDLGLAVSYRVSDRLSIGGGPDFDYFDARLTQNIDVPGLSALTGQDPVADVHGNSLGAGYNLGALYQFDANTRLGLDYRSRIRHDITGEQKVTVPAIYGLYSPLAVRLLESGNSAATTSVTLPDTLSAGIYREVAPRLAIMASLAWTEWSLLNTFNVTPTNGAPGTIVTERYRNTWYAGAGANYLLLTDLLLQTGFGYDQSPVTDDNRTTRVPDADHYDIGVGLQYLLTRRANMQLAYAHVFTPGGRITSTASTAALTPSGSITGAYDDSDNSVTLGLVGKF